MRRYITLTGLFLLIAFGASAQIVGQGIPPIVSAPPGGGGGAAYSGAFGGVFDEEGTIAGAGTLTCGTAVSSSWQVCHATASGSITIANPTHLPTNAMVWIALTTTQNTTIAWGTNFLGWVDNSGFQSINTGNFWTVLRGGTNATVLYPFWSDGTNLSIAMPNALELLTLQTNTLSAGNGTFSASTSGNKLGAGDNTINSAPRMSFPSFIDATAATTTVPYGCTLTNKAVTFQNVQFTVTSVTQSVAPSLSLCDTGTTANPVACGTTIVNSGTFTAAGNISLTSMTNANVAAAHFVCTFFAAGTATVVIGQVTGTAVPQ